MHLQKAVKGQLKNMWKSVFLTVSSVTVNSNSLCALTAYTGKVKCFSTSIYGCLTTKPIFKKGGSLKFQKRVQKIINSKEKKRVWHNTNLMELPAHQSGPANSEGNQKRAKQLSRVFTDHITNIVNSGEAHPLLPELGFSISEVNMAPDIRYLVVKWVGTGTSKDDQMEEVLPDAAKYLRQALTNMHLMGNVPKVKFVKDMTSARVQEVEALLSVADFGPDHEPTALGHDLKELPKDSTAMSRIQDDFHKLSRKFGDQEIMESDFVKCSDMKENKTEIVESDADNPNLKDLGINVKSDIYNVDHASLMSKIKQATKQNPRGGIETNRVSESAQSRSSPKNKFTRDLTFAPGKPYKQSTKSKADPSPSAKKIFRREELDLMRQPVSKNDNEFDESEDSSYDYIEDNQSKK